MPCYNFHNENWLWSAYKESVPADTNLDEPLRATVLEIVADEHDCEETRERAERRLEEINPWD